MANPNETSGHTQLWTGGHTAVSRWPKTPLARCPRCKASTIGEPFCRRDGTLTAAAPFLVGERYLVEELLGAGGMSLVFGARHQLLGKPVALKVLREAVGSDQEQAQRFFREARLASQLHHENIVDISDFGRDERLGVLYLVMERLRGQTLASELERHGRLPWRRAVPILVQLCRALAAAHEQQVLHRDLNPANVFLVQSSGGGDGVKLCDFGLSRLAGGEDRITAMGTFLGTPAYMSPEQIRGDAAQDARTDLYALGVTAYEMLTGTLPHAATNPVALVTRKLNSDAVPLRQDRVGLEIPAPLEAVIMRCLARATEERPSSAAEVERVLAGLALGPTEVSAPAPLPSEMIGQTVGSYRVTGLLGTGGVGSVYLAEHPVIGTKVAIKVLLPEVLAIEGVVDRFILEARAASAIDSPSMPRYFDFGTLPGGHPYAVMEYLEGETVAERLKRAGVYSLEEATQLLQQIAGALELAHEAGIIHRDIKPENLFLVTGTDGHSVVKVLDFGIAKLAAPEKDGRLTQVGFIVGTPYYAPPEQLVGADVTPAVDVYALGSTLFEMLTGRAPFEGGLSDLVLAKSSTEAPAISSLRPGLPAGLVETLARMLARDPSARPAMKEVRARALAWMEPAPTPTPRSRRGRAIAAATAVLALALSLTWLLRPRSDPPRSPAVADAPARAPSVAPPQAAAPTRVAPSGVTTPEPAIAAHDDAPTAPRPSAGTRAKSKRGTKTKPRALIADPFED